MSLYLCVSKYKNIYLSCDSKTTKKWVKQAALLPQTWSKTQSFTNQEAKITIGKV